MCSETVATVETTAVAGPVVGDVCRVSGEVVLLLLEALFGDVACPCGLLSMYRSILSMCV